jgi:argininosuccinate lyase
MQEDKECVFDSVDTVVMCIDITKGMIETMKALPDNMMKAAQRGFINATDLADYLVKKGMPFRQAYKISGSIVADCIKQGQVLETLPLSEYKKYSDVFENDLYNEIDLRTCVEKRISVGGTSVGSVENQINYVKEILAK